MKHTSLFLELVPDAIADLKPSIEIAPKVYSNWNISVTNIQLNLVFRACGLKILNSNSKMSHRRVTAVNFANECSANTTATHVIAESLQQQESSHEEEESVSCYYSFLFNEKENAKCPHKNMHKLIF